MLKESDSMISINLGVADRAHHNLNEGPADPAEPSEIVVIQKSQPDMRKGIGKDSTEFP